MGGDDLPYSIRHDVADPDEAAELLNAAWAEAELVPEDRDQAVAWYGEIIDALTRGYGSDENKAWQRLWLKKSNHLSVVSRRAAATVAMLGRLLRTQISCPSRITSGSCATSQS